MSLTTKQIDELRAYAKDRKGELAKLINDAADTIEVLSAKLHASQMERSSQYYHGGWIPCSERLPKKSGRYIVTEQNFGGSSDANIHDVTVHSVYFRADDKEWDDADRRYVADVSNITAWMPLLTAYREEGDNS